MAMTDAYLSRSDKEVFKALACGTFKGTRSGALRVLKNEFLNEPSRFYRFNECLHVCAQWGKDSPLALAFVRLMLRRGADPNLFLSDLPEEGTPMHRAIQVYAVDSKAKLAMFNLLLRDGRGNVLLPTRGFCNFSPINKAAFKGCFLGLRHALLSLPPKKRGAILNADLDIYSRTPLHNAARAFNRSRGIDYVPIIKLLVRAGASPQAEDCEGATPLDLAETGLIYKAMFA